MKASTNRWVVLGACCLTIAFSSGFPFNMAVLFVEFKDTFEKSNAETSLVQAFSSGIFLTSGSISGIAVDKLGPRLIGISGAMLAAFGIGLSFIATSLEFLILTVGIITGFGLSMVYIASYGSVENHFDGKAKIVALSIASYSAGFGVMAMTPMMSVFTGKYGWRGYFLIMAGICLNLVPCLALCHGRIASNEDNVAMLQRKISTLDILKSIMKTKTYIVIVFGFLAALPIFDAVTFQMINILKLKGRSKEEAVLLYIIMDIASTGLRFIPGLLKCLPHFSVIAIPLIYCFCSMVTLAFFPYCYGYYDILVAMCALGFSRGGLICAIPMTTSNIVPRECYSTALGIMLTFIGLSTIAASPLFGYLRDTTGSYVIPLYVAAGAQGGACLLFIIGLYVRKIHSKRHIHHSHDKNIG